ncbi:MAG: DMT family transporter [Rhodospirillales bacterium]|nr:DMT family transporter [Rhodospirillales bacterium]
MIGAAGLSAADTIMVRLLTQDLHPFLIVFFRSVFGLLFISPWILRKSSVLKSNYAWLHLLRAALKILSLVAFFLAIAEAALADVTAIAFTTPVFVTLGAWAILKEQPGLRRVIAVIFGFVGVLVIIRPGSGPVSPALFYAVGGAMIAAVIHLMLKRMSARDSTETLIAWNLIVTVPLAAIPVYWFWTTPSWQQLALLALQGGVGALNMAMITRAMALADVSHIAPIDFLRLPAVALLAYLLFGEAVTASTLLGGGVIFVSTLLMAAAIRK